MYVLFCETKGLYDRRSCMNKRSTRNLVSTWLLPIVSTVLGLSVIAVIWLLPQAQGDEGWYDMSAQIEERLLQEANDEKVDKADQNAMEGLSSIPSKLERPAASNVMPIILEDSNTAAVQVESQAHLHEPLGPKQQAIVEGQKEQKEQEDASSTVTEQQKAHNSVPPSPVSDGLINVNEANVDELMELPGIGPSKAKAIVQYRDIYGPFQKVDELLEVKGIGPRILEQMRSKVTLGF